MGEVRGSIPRSSIFLLFFFLTICSGLPFPVAYLFVCLSVPSAQLSIRHYTTTYTPLGHRFAASTAMCITCVCTYPKP
ncbi:hypothetical protein BP00DRAFT_99231 [Aspergillus indologenus CBS 114.80]|uniref:Uncharacterized protein n=1 Tax=Aspergillus indologenus CBS 114.80 TaxID=1450541 RepID=A0A2V5INM7_9EURO|nr:hypothetical protein BP00DRAFT_99231 [Aspergillus indologenus CBS 114.80]